MILTCGTQSIRYLMIDLTFFFHPNSCVFKQAERSQYGVGCRNTWWLEEEGFRKEERKRKGKRKEEKSVYGKIQRLLHPRNVQVPEGHKRTLVHVSLSRLSCDFLIFYAHCIWLFYVCTDRVTRPFCPDVIRATLGRDVTVSPWKLGPKRAGTTARRRWLWWLWFFLLYVSPSLDSY